ncbi:MAG TPA: hypothetical protein VIT22_06065 [Pseudoxanthomonas sp.]
MGSFSAAQAEIVQGRLELRWGDPIPASGKPEPSARFVATLVTDGGTRHALDPMQARRAAVDLYALANRRVAVEFSPSKRGGGVRSIEAIVPVDRPWLPASSKALVAPKAVIGNTRWVTIACKFSDIATEQKTIAFFRGQYGTNPGQVGHYWREVSYGKISLTGSDAYGWFTLPQPRSHYVAMVNGEEDADLNLLFDDCTAAADSTVDFNGVQGVNMMFNGDLDGYAWGGGRCGVALDGPGRCLSTTWNPPWAFNNLAPFAHEMGHGYGLPHSNNSDGDDDTYDNPWDVMSDGWSNAVSNATYGSLPKHINTRQRDRLGWVDAARKLTVPAGGAAKNVVLDRASLAGSANRQMIVLPLAAADAKGNVSYTVEARGPTGNYEAALAGKAVIIHGINAGGIAYSMDADVPPADTSNNEGSMFKVGETWISPDGSQRVKVDSATVDGFVVTIGWPRETGGNQRPRQRPASVVPAALGPSQEGSSADPAPRRERQSCDFLHSPVRANACREK